jgi:uncharacterized protein
MNKKAPLPDAVFLAQSEYRRMRWKNGAGWTSEITLENAIDGEFLWRISIADIDADSDFSIFPSIDRTLVVLSGGGMVLDLAGAESVELRPLEKPLVFAGEERIRARLSAGPTRDFNVMTRRAAFTHQLRIHRSGASLSVTRNEDTALFFHITSGTLWGAMAGDSWLVPRGTPATIELPADVALIVVELCQIRKD